MKSNRRQPRELSPAEALARAEALCARSEQCEYEIREKLRRWGVAEEEHDPIIDSLIERRFVDDVRYVSAYVRSKRLYSRWGRWKISMGLAAKRIPRALVDSALAAVSQADWLAVAVPLTRAKARTLDDPTSREGRMKLARFLLGRGFEGAIVE